MKTNNAIKENQQDSKQTNNIVGFRNTSVEGRIDMFLEVTREDSENTYTSYKGHINEYFMYTIGREIKDIAWSDIYTLTVEDTWRYRQHLQTKRIPLGKDANGKYQYKIGQAPSTINSKIASVSALFNFLQSLDSKINSSITNVKRVKPSKKNVSYGSLTEDEFNDLLKFCDSEPIKPKTKRMFFELAIHTGMRKNAIIKNLTWNNIRKHKDNQTGIFIWAINNVEDKGGKNDVVPISDNFYERLLEFKRSDEVEYEFDDINERVINLDPKTVDSVLKRYREKYNIDVERKITVHSIKSTGCDMVWERTKDIKAVCDYAHHEDINTTYKHYLGKNESLMNKASYYVFDSKPDVEKLNELSKDEIIELIASCSTGTISEIANKLE